MTSARSTGCGNMPTGTGHFAPQGRFAFPRSYIYYIAWNIENYTVSNVLNVYTWTYIPDPMITHTITLAPKFYPWSSNNFTSDYVIEEYYYQFFPGGPKTYPDFRLDYYIHPGFKRMGFIFYSADNRFATSIISNLPTAPSTYWLPPPLI